MNKRFHYFGLLMTVVMLALSSCVKDDTDLDEVIKQYQVQPVEIELDFSALAEAADVPVTDEADTTYNDYVENTDWNRVVNITFNGETATVDGSVPGLAIQRNGAHLTITNIVGPIKFVVSGTTANGSLKFYGDKRFQLLLNGANIANPTGAAINNQGGKSMYIVLAEGSNNHLADGADYIMVDDEDQKAALFSEGQIIFSGKGSLTVNAVGRGGIRSDDYIRVRPGVKIHVNSTALDGLRANDGITLDGGVINVETSGAGAKGVRSGGPLTVNGGRLTAISHGDTRIEVEDVTDTTACAALYCDMLMTVNSGVIRLKATGDGGKGVNAKQNVVISGGSLEAVATGTAEEKSPKGVKIDGNFSIGAGYFYAYSKRSDPIDVSGTTDVAAGYKTLDHGPKLLIIAY